MKPFDRGILIFYSATITLFFLTAAAYLSGWQEPLLVLSQETLLPENMEVLWILLGFYVFMGAWLFWRGIRGQRNKQAVVHERSLGQVRISLPAIESLAEKEAFTVEGIKEARAKVIAVSQGININLKVVVTPDISIPDLSEDLQQRVKDKIYNVVGITVSGVQVAVDSFLARKTRVE